MRTKSIAGRNAEAGGNRTRKVRFELAASPGRKVFLAGSFNAWKADSVRMRFSKRTGRYGVTLNLAPGVYEYKFTLNGEWQIDPECEQWVGNCYDTLNSVIEVK